MFKRFVVSGTKKDNILTGTDRLDIMFGKNGDDVLEGRGGWDFLFGGKGNDKLFGGDGNDWLFGGKGNDQLFGEDGNDKLFGGKGSDFLDGGAGSDYLFGGKGDDTFNFTLSENSGAKDYYDGGKGLDTLQLTLTSAEYDAAKAEIDEFKALLADGGKDFHFDSLGLSVRNFEGVNVELVGGGNAAPVAEDDSFTFDEDTPTVLDVLANDVDADVESLSAVIVDGPANGTLDVSEDGILTYTPNANFNGSDSFTYHAFDGTEASNLATVSLQINAVNDDPVAVDDAFTGLTATKVISPINVAVIGVANSSYTLAADQLNDSAVFDFIATTIDYTNNRIWADLNADNYDVVVLGNSGFDDYAGETGSLFTALNTFVGAGGGVVTTGFFASALFGMRDGTNNVDTPLSLAADAITPITSNPIPATVKGAADITVLPPAHPIVDGLASAYVSNATWHEFAARVNEDEGAVQLATSVVGTNTMTAIAYDADVGPGHGRTAYLGGTYLANSSFFDTGPLSGIRDPEGVSDQIFEQAIAWAAGARGTATVNINPADLLENDSDPDSAFAISALSSTGLYGAVSFDENGNIVYSLGEAGLQKFLADGSITDSFEYTISDGNLFDTASVSLSIDTLL
jgi:VCBS repeat-containing protein